MGFWTLFKQNVAAALKGAWQFLVRYPVAILLAVGVVAFGLLAVSLGYQPNLGGLLKKLFGRAPGKESVIAAANSVPEKRVDKHGVEIPVGVPDANGWTQWEVREYKTPTNPLRDKSVITVESAGKPVEIALPTGIEDTDVEQVIEVQPEVFVVKTRTDTKVKAKDLLDRLPRPPRNP